MALPLTGTISLLQIQAEFGGSGTIGLSEYYRNGLYVTSNNTGIPTSGVISMSSFRGAVRSRTVEYQIIGAGGGGGSGVSGGSGSGKAPDGGESKIASTEITNVVAAGGVGGLNGNLAYNTTVDRNGQATIYGLGGAAGGNRSNGSPAPTTSYGAGGGGSGGDPSSTYDSSGNSGSRGGAGTYITGSKQIIPGIVLTVTIGAKGLGNDSTYDGGAGANGYARIRKDTGPDGAFGAWTVFTASGTFTV